MTIEEAKQAEGLWVMSRDAGHKLIRSVPEEHGPYLLKKVTKRGMAIIARWPDEDLSVPPSLLSLSTALSPEYFEMMANLLRQMWPDGINLAEILEANKLEDSEENNTIRE